MKKKNKSLSQEIKDTQKYFNRYIRERDNHRCFCCEIINPKISTAGHLITTNCKSVIFDERQVHCQCRGCNYEHEFRPEIYTQKYIKKFGLSQYNEIIRISKQLKKWTREDLHKLKGYYKFKLEKEYGIKI